MQGMMFAMGIIALPSMGSATISLAIAPTALQHKILLRGMMRTIGGLNCRRGSMEGLDHRDTVTDFALPEGTFFDVAMVHLLTMATLDRLRELYPQGRFEVRRFRPNIVVQLASTEKGSAENAWVGHTLAIWTAVRLDITGPCGRCVMTTLAQRDLGILRTAAHHNQVNIGVYAAVGRGGTIRRGDPVRLE
jgi:uncharacterized protein YcbX